MNWLAESASSPAPPRLALLVATSGLRLMAAVSVFVYARNEIRRQQLFGARARLVLATSAFAWLPFPFSILAAPTWMPLVSVPREQRTLVRAAHVPVQGSDSARLRQMLAGIRRGKSRAGTGRGASRSAPAMGWAEQHRRAFYRLKTLLLFVDAAALGWGLARYRSFGPFLLRQPFSRISLAFLAPFGLGLLIGGAALVASLKSGDGRVDPWWRQPYGRFVAASQSSCVAGLISGVLLETGTRYTLGLVLSTVAMLDLLALFGFWIVAELAGRPGSSTPMAVTWMVLLGVIVCAGALLRIDAASPRPVIGLLCWAMALTPLLHLALALAMADFLVRPACLWQVVSGGLAAGTRTLPALVVLTAALPLGGLAIPFWIYARHRRWPEYERRWRSLAA
jgi:hypothetical protein